MKNINNLSIAAVLAGVIFSSPLFAAPNHIDDTLQAIEQEKISTNIYKAFFPNLDIARKTSISFHNQLLESHFDKNYLILELTPSEIESLKEFDFTFEKATTYIEKRNKRLEKIHVRLKNQQLNGDIVPQAIPGYACYETVEESFAAAEGMVTNFPNLAEIIDIGDSWEKNQGLSGYDIKVLKLTNKSTTVSKPKLFINSAIHAREYTTAPLNLAFAQWLIQGYGTNADATWILDTQEVHLLLQTNPDGRKKAEQGISWRKNTNQAYCGTTSNSRGADLNRNFSSRWNITNGQGSSGNPCSATYRGPSAGSEPEIQALENYLRQLWPDKRGPNDNDAAPTDTSGIHIDIHSYSELILWPWGDQRNAAPNGTAMQTLGRKFAHFNNYYPQQSIGLYATDGTSDSISYGELGVPAFTFELGTSFFQNCSTYENTIKPDNLPALIYAAKVTRRPYITPSGPDVYDITLSNNASTDGVGAGTQVTLNASSTDTRFNTRNGRESTHNITSAEYYIDTPPWVAGANPIAISATDSAYDEKTEALTGTIDTTGLSVGSHIVYVRSQDTTQTWGAVSAVFLKITDDTPPALSANFTFSCQQLSCNFNGSNSTGNIINYAWSFGDGGSASGETSNHNFTNSGTYTVKLTVNDASASDSKSIDVTVSQSSPSTIDLSLSPGSLLFFTWVDVSWTGANTNQVDIYRDNALVTSTNNDGSYRNYVDRGKYTYKVCESGSSSNCSDDIAIDF